MKTRTFGFLLMLGFCARGILAQSRSGSAAPPSVVIKAGKLLDVRKGSYVENAAVWIDGERIKQVGAAAEIEAQAAKNPKVIDLGRATVLPGLIDCHTRIMARFDESENGYLLGLATKSPSLPRTGRRPQRPHHPRSGIHDHS